MFDVSHIIQHGGLLVITLIIFAESGMMVGFFLPGDTLLITAGIFAAKGHLSLGLALLFIALAAIIGDNVGYQIGRFIGPRVFDKKDSLLFRQEYLEKARTFFDKYGNKAMLVAHFIPVVRAFAPVAAGAAQMNRRTFVTFDAIGDVAWTIIITLFGYFVASKIPGVEKYVEPVLLLVIVLTVGPALYQILKDPRFHSKLKRLHKRKKHADKN
jgi:membrane-associated protein